MEIGPCEIEKASNIFIRTELLRKGYATTVTCGSELGTCRLVGRRESGVGDWGSVVTKRSEYLGTLLVRYCTVRPLYVTATTWTKVIIANECCLTGF
jgi:hypothetical protein